MTVLKERLDTKGILAWCMDFGDAAKAIWVKILLALSEVDPLNVGIFLERSSRTRFLLTWCQYGEAEEWQRVFGNCGTRELGRFVHSFEGGTWKERTNEVLAGALPHSGVSITHGAIEAAAFHFAVLPAGVTEVLGAFEEGNIVTIFDASGAALGAAISRYSSVELEQIRGHHSTQIESILGLNRGSSVLFRSSVSFNIEGLQYLHRNWYGELEKTVSTLRRLYGWSENHCRRKAPRFMSRFFDASPY